MRFLSRIRRDIIYMLRRNVDLVGLWLALLIAQHFIPPTEMLARDDLLPWLAVSLSGVALLRGRMLGAGPHPMLTRRQPEFARYAHKISLAVTPWVLLALMELAVARDVRHLGLAGGAVVALAVLLAVSSGYDRTAWVPRPSRAWLPWLFGVLFALGGAALIGLGREAFAESPWTVPVTSGTWLGLSFASVGWVSGSAVSHRQRVRAGRKDGRRYRAPKFPSFLGIFGPSVSLGVLLWVVPDLDFRFAFAGALLVAVWGAVIWPRTVPVAVACLLHEVLPIGGKDTPHPDSAKPFDRPPDGALRFNPLRTRRTRVMYSWYVPVQASRIADLDDPVRPLWPVAPEAVSYHVLGDARFEPDPFTKGPQWDVLTVRMKSQDDTVSVSEGADAAKTRRMVILRPFARGGLFRRSRMRTYRWDPRVPRDAVQVLDHTTEVATLRNGDVILLSIEGVAHAYEFEVGAPIYQAPGALNARPPQLGDYVAL